MGRIAGWSGSALIALLLITALKSHLAAQPASAAQDPAIRYVVRPVVHGSLLALDVTVSFTGEASGRTELRMPSDRFGVPPMHRFIRDLELNAGRGPSRTMVAAAPAFRSARANPTDILRRQ